MSLAANPIANPGSLFTISKASHSHPYLSIPLKPFKLQLSCSYSASLSLPSFLSARKKEPISRASVIAAYQEENNPVDLEEGNLNWDAPESDVVEPNEEAKLYVGNLPYDVDDAKLAGLFQGAGVVEIAEIIRHRDTEESRGFAFVTMSTVEEAEKAVELFHRYDIGGRLLIVNKAAPKGSRPERAPREFRSGSRIYVGNLPWSADDSRLEQIFKEYGKVVSARVVFDRETGRSRGFGFVEMATDSGMNDAIANLDGQNLDGRAIRVNVAADRRQSGF